MPDEKRSEERERTLKNARLLGAEYATPVFGIEMIVMKENGEEEKDIPACAIANR
jgi:hypothetical protein